jgi:4-hydroxythreonine-4-phosphate dehydrogenase
MISGQRNPDCSPPGARARPLIGVTMGDPCGIGAEVIVKALDDAEIRASGRFIVFGMEAVLRHAARLASVKPFWFPVQAHEVGRVDSGVIVADFEDYARHDWSVPRPTEWGGRASLRFLDAAISMARPRMIDAIVTGPIHKTSWHLAGSPFPGHTEKLAAAFDCKRFNMMFEAPGLRVALATTHVGLFELRNHFNIGLVFQPIDLLNEALRNWFGIECPRIAVAGLNPHAGEDGEPAIQMAANTGVDVQGPFPADTLFIPSRRSRFDGIVAMYHDQGLVPVKLLAFDRAVNLTLGLPILRTSVDHGTAYDIAGRNLADPGSMKEALRLALRLASGRIADPRTAEPAYQTL